MAEEPELKTAVEQEQAMDSMMISQEMEAPRKMYDEMQEVVDSAQRDEDRMAESIESQETQRECSESEQRTEVTAPDAEQVRAVEVGDDDFCKSATRKERLVGCLFA